MGADFFLGAVFFLGAAFFLGSGLFLGSLLGLQGSGGLLLVLGAELVGGLHLGEVTISYGLLQGVEEDAVHPLLVSGQVGLHVLLDGDGGAAGAVLELRDGGEDSCFV